MLQVDGCTDETACNYSEAATEDDGSCEYAELYYDCDGNCLAGTNGDGICNEIPGCTDATACNFNAEATEDDGSCLLLDDCYACGVPVSYHGYDYATVLIGEQCWFAENLRSANYDNGDAIPSGLSGSEWASTYEGATAQHPNQGLYGRLYNYRAVIDSRGLCPSGWHVPSNGEWNVLADNLGGEEVAGTQMKATYGWADGGNGTNSSGFTGFPGGHRNSWSGGWSGLPNWLGNWWTTDYDYQGARARYLMHTSERLGWMIEDRRFGYSVRCVRDAE